MSETLGLALERLIVSPGMTPIVPFRAIRRSCNRKPCSNIAHNDRGAVDGSRVTASVERSFSPCMAGVSGEREPQISLWAGARQPAIEAPLRRRESDRGLAMINGRRGILCFNENCCASATRSSTS